MTAASRPVPGGGEGSHRRGGQHGQTGDVKEQMLLPVGLYCYEDREAYRELKQGKDCFPTALRTADKPDYRPHRQQDKKNEPKISADEQSVAPKSQIIGGVDVSVVCSQHLLQQEVRGEIDCTYGAGGKETGKIRPAFPLKQELFEKGRHPERGGEKEEVPPQKKADHQQETGHNAAAHRWAVAVVDNIGPYRRGAGGGVHKADHSGVDQHGK